MDKRFLIVLTVVILGLAGLFIFTRNKANAPSAGGGTSSASTTSNHTEGGNAKKVSLIVYGDFQCPACEQMYPIEKQVVQKYYNDISFTFRHFPLDSIHPNARAASRAAEAAGLQGKFFEMHNSLYENQSLWVSQSDPLPSFVQLATALNLNIDKFKTDFASEAVNSTINADLNQGKKDSIEGTPTYILNGQKLNNQDISSVDKFSAKIDEAIKSSK